MPFRHWKKAVFALAALTMTASEGAAAQGAAGFFDQAPQSPMDAIQGFGQWLFEQPALKTILEGRSPEQWCQWLGSPDALVRAQYLEGLRHQSREMAAAANGQGLIEKHLGEGKLPAITKNACTWSVQQLDMFARLDKTCAKKTWEIAEGSRFARETLRDLKTGGQVSCPIPAIPDERPESPKGKERRNLPTLNGSGLSTEYHAPFRLGPRQRQEVICRFDR